ncbi:MAG: response regulator, partial [Bacteroidota bacterium]
LNLKVDEYMQGEEVPYSVAGLCLLPDRRVLVQTDQGGLLWSLDDPQNPLKKVPLERSTFQPAPRLSATDENRIFWLSRKKEERIFFWHPTEEKVLHQTFSQDDYLKAVCKDHTGLLWVGTASNGIHLYSLRPKPFEVYQYDQASSLPGVNHMYGMAQDTTGRVWISSSQGLNLFDLSKKKLAPLSPGIQQHLNAPQAFALHLSKRHPDRLWIGYFHKQLSQLNWAAEKNIPFLFKPGDSTSFGGWSIRSLLEDRSGRLWIGETRNLYRLDASQNVFQSLTVDPPGKGIPKDQAIWALHEDQFGDVWVGTHTSGLIRFRQGGPKFDQWLHDANDPHTLSENSIKCIAEDRKGNLWCGTLSGGLCYLERSTGKVWRFSMQDGLPDHMIHGMLPQNDSTWWISTNNGLCRVQLPPGFPQNRTLRVNQFYEADGLADDEFNLNSYLKTREGYMLFGGDQGVTVFHPDSLELNNYGEAPQRVGLWVQNQAIHAGDRVDDQVLMAQSIEESDEMILPPGVDIFSIAFVAVNFRTPDQVQYAYQLEGFDEAWIHTDSRNRKATYTNLNPGTYTFHLKAMHGDGMWLEHTRPLTIHVLPPWWQRTWIRWVALFFLMGLVGLWIRLRTFRLRKRNEELGEQVQQYTQTLQQQAAQLQQQNADLHTQNEEIERLAASVHALDQQKIEFFTNISHDLRTPLSLILGPARELLDRTPASSQSHRMLETLYRNSQRMLRLANQALDLERIDQQALSLQVREGELRTWTETVYQAFQFEAIQRKQTFTLQLPSTPIPAWFDSDKLEKILFNLLSNAIKFTPEAGTITVVVEPISRNEMAWARFSVRNSGTKLDALSSWSVFDRFHQGEAGKKDQSGTGIGLALTRQLVHLHKGTIKAEMAGTQEVHFWVEVPISLDAFAKEEQQATLPAPSTQAEGYLESAKEETLPLPALAPETYILLVEDHVELRAYLQERLGRYFSVQVAENGAVGLKMARETLPNLIVSDVMMPEMDGFEMVKNVKSDPLTSHIPVLLLTAKHQEKSQLEGLEQGADDYMVKPIFPRILRLKIQNLLASRQRYAETLAARYQLSPPELALTQEAVDPFLARVEECLETNLANEEFGVEDLANALGVSRTQLYRKVRALVGQPVNQFLLQFRVWKAKEMLESSDWTVAEVAYRVGFKSAPHFSRVFKRVAGVPPSAVNLKKPSASAEG